MNNDRKGKKRKRKLKVQEKEEEGEVGGERKNVYTTL